MSKEKRTRNGKKNTKNISEELKEKITSQYILVLSRKKGKFRVETNISGHAIGGVLFQEQEEKQKPIVFSSVTIQVAE